MNHARCTRKEQSNGTVYRGHAAFGDRSTTRFEISTMVRRIFLATLAILTLSHSIATAREQLRVVVHELDANGVSQQVARVVSDHLRGKLIETHRFVIPEREKMVEILNEQSISLSLGECSSQQCAIELGRLLQANKMIVGTISLLAETYSINIRYLDLQSGAAEFSAEEQVNATEDLYLAAERLAARVVAFVPPRGNVTAVTDDHAIIDIGRVDGITPGMQFRIMRSVELVPGYPEEQPVATAEVSAVQETWSRLTVAQERQRTRRQTVQIGDIAIGPQTVAVQELPQYGYIMVFSRPVGAEVYVDNLFRGRTVEDGLEVRVPAGKHQIRLSAPAHRVDERAIEIATGQRVPFHATLQPILPRRVFDMAATNLSYLRQKPSDELFRSQLATEALHGVQLGFGRVYSVWTSEIGGSWAMANMAPDRGYGLNEVHRLGAYGQIGLALPTALFVPYGAVGYEIARFMFNEQDVLDGDENLGAAGKISNNGWYWTCGVYFRKWLHVGYRGTFDRLNSDLHMMTIGLNLSGF